MTPETVSAMEPEPQRMGEFSRLTGVFFEPAKTFADIAQRPAWFVPLLLVIIAIVAFNVTYGQRVGWERFTQQQIENSPRMQQRMEQASPEQREQQARLQAKIMPIMYYAGPIFGMPLAFLFGALVLWGVASGIMSAGVRYKQVFAIVCYASLTMVIVKILAIVVVFLKNPDDVNFMNPLAFNPAAFMDQKTSSKFLYTLGTAFDIFAIWTLILEAIGLKAAAGKRLSMGGAAFAVALPFVVFLLIGAGAAALFS